MINKVEWEMRYYSCTDTSIQLREHVVSKFTKFILLYKIIFNCIVILG